MAHDLSIKMCSREQHNMSLLLWYRLDETVVADIGKDYSGNGLDLTNNGVGILVDPNTNERYPWFDYSGGFVGNLTLDSVNVPPTLRGLGSFTLSFWVYVVSPTICDEVYRHGSGQQKLQIEWGDDGKMQLLTSNIKTGSTVGSAYTHTQYLLTYDADVFQIRMYNNGVLQGSYNKAVNIPESDDVVFGSELWGRLSDVRVYDVVLSAADVTTLYNGGRLYENFTSLSAVMYTHLADLSWLPLPNASSYRIGRSADGGSEEIVESSTTEISYVVYNLSPSVSYVFNIYTAPDFVTPVASSTGDTPSLTSASVASLISRLSNDVSNLSTSTFTDIGPFISTALTTGDLIKVTTSDEPYVFVGDAGTIEHTGTDILTSFEQGSSQTITVTIAGEDTSVSYNGVNNEVQTSGGTTGVGEYFVVGSYKVVVKEV